MWNGGVAASCFSETRASARLARRAGPIAHPPRFRPEWADEGGPSTGNESIGRTPTSDQGKRTEAGVDRSPTPGGDPSGEGWGTYQGRDQGTLRGPTRGRPGGREIAVERPGIRTGIALGNSAAGRTRGPKSASARPGPCTWPRSADALTRRELPAGPTSGRRQGRSSSAASCRPAGTVLGLWAAWRGLQLDPGSGRMVPRTRVGRSALRATAPAGRGRSRAPRRPAHSIRRPLLVEHQRRPDRFTSQPHSGHTAVLDRLTRSEILDRTRRST
jgi:hypothetical protein